MLNEGKEFIAMHILPGRGGEGVRMSARGASVEAATEELFLKMQRKLYRLRGKKQLRYMEEKQEEYLGSILCMPDSYVPED